MYYRSWTILLSLSWHLASSFASPMATITPAPSMAISPRVAQGGGGGGGGGAGDGVANNNNNNVENRPPHDSADAAERWSIAMQKLSGGLQVASSAISIADAIVGSVLQSHIFVTSMSIDHQVRTVQLPTIDSTVTKSGGLSSLLVGTNSAAATATGSVSYSSVTLCLPSDLPLIDVPSATASPTTLVASAGSGSVASSSSPGASSSAIPTSNVQHNSDSGSSSSSPGLIPTIINGIFKMASRAVPRAAQKDDGSIPSGVIGEPLGTLDNATTAVISSCDAPMVNGNALLRDAAGALVLQLTAQDALGSGLVSRADILHYLRARGGGWLAKLELRL